MGEREPSRALPSATPMAVPRARPTGALAMNSTHAACPDAVLKRAWSLLSFGKGIPAQGLFWPRPCWTSTSSARVRWQACRLGGEAPCTALWPAALRPDSANHEYVPFPRR